MFFTLSEKKKAFKAQHPRAKLLSLGIGDVSLPLSQSALHALLKAAHGQGRAASFQGYQPECGASFLRRAVAAHYAQRGIALSEDEIFVSSGAGEDLGLLPGLFSPENLVLIPSPCYPAYAEVAAMHGMRVLPLRCDAKSGFLPLPPRDIDAGVIYLCSPQNPTGVAMPRRLLQDWVNYANACGAVIIYDAAYEAFLAGSAYPRSIFEMEGSRSCAVEICSFSKSAGFTGLRCGYTVVPGSLYRGGQSLNAMWERTKFAKTNGVCYPVQRAAAAVLTARGQKQTQKAIQKTLQNAGALRKALQDLALPFFGGEHSPYLWVACPQGMTSSDCFDFLLEHAAILCSPGTGFGAGGEGYIRLSAFAPRRQIYAAAARLRSLFKS